MARVLIVGDHPHRGKTGTLTGEVIRLKGGPEMAKVTLDEPGFGTEECYAEAAHLQPVTSAFNREAPDAH